MTHHITKSLVAAGLFLVLAGLETSTLAQNCRTNPRSCAVSRGYSYGLQITDVRPIGAAMVEHEAVEVSYEGLIRPFGLVGELPPLPPQIRICPQEQVENVTTCREITSPRPNQRYRGKVRAQAPVAGRHSTITLLVEAPIPAGEHYGWKAVDSAQQKVSVAARYEVSIESFETLHTRSARTDTVRINLQSLVKSDPPHRSDRDDACRLQGFRWCQMNIKYGDVRDGLHAVRDVRVGPYLLTPELEGELRVLYTLYNFGDSYNQKLGQAIADGFSKAGMIILMGSGTGFSGAAQPLEKQMSELHKAAFAGCDGLMAVDARTLVNRTVPDNPDETLDKRTITTGEYRPGPSQVYEGGEYADGNTRCGAGGEYRVTYVVHRTSWRKPK